MSTFNHTELSNIGCQFTRHDRETRTRKRTLDVRNTTAESKIWERTKGVLKRFLFLHNVAVHILYRADYCESPKIMRDNVKVSEKILCIFSGMKVIYVSNPFYS